MKEYRVGICIEDTIEAEDETEAIFNKIAPNGVWTINGSKPKDMEE